MRTGRGDVGASSPVAGPETKIGRHHHSSGYGKVFVVGLGPGDFEQMSYRCRAVLEEAQVIVGYKTYIDLIRELVSDKEIVDSGMRKEVERCQLAIDIALTGKSVAVVSSGDAGIYGMAGVVLELVAKQNLLEQLPVEVVPGISSAVAAAASLGAPLMHDYVTLSLSDLLTPWELIEKRLEYSAAGDFVVCLYNPVSKKRTEQIKVAQQIMLKYKAPQTPVAIVRNAKRGDEERIITTLQAMLTHKIDMFCVIIIGNANSYVAGQYMLTPRGYNL